MQIEPGYRRGHGQQTFVGTVSPHHSSLQNGVLPVVGDVTTSQILYQYNLLHAFGLDFPPQAQYHAQSNSLADLRFVRVG